MPSRGLVIGGRGRRAAAADRRRRCGTAPTCSAAARPPDAERDAVGRADRADAGAPRRSRRRRGAGQVAITATDEVWVRIYDAAGTDAADEDDDAGRALRRAGRRQRTRDRGGPARQADGHGQRRRGRRRSATAGVAIKDVSLDAASLLRARCRDRRRATPTPTPTPDADAAPATPTARPHADAARRRAPRRRPPPRRRADAAVRPPRAGNDRHRCDAADTAGGYDGEAAIVGRPVLTAPGGVTCV